VSPALTAGGASGAVVMSVLATARSVHTGDNIGFAALFARSANGAVVSGTTYRATTYTLRALASSPDGKFVFATYANGRIAYCLTTTPFGPMDPSSCVYYYVGTSVLAFASSPRADSIYTADVAGQLIIYSISTNQM
jgi:hypothetical protein